MKPVRRRIRRHFGLTAKQVAVRSRRPWYFQWGISTLLLVIGYAVAYWQLTSGEDMGEKFRQVSAQNQSLQTKLIQIERQLQIELVTQHNLEQELNHVQDENMHMKEDLLFYKTMVKNKKPTPRR
jgi:hypothetical protein